MSNPMSLNGDRLEEEMKTKSRLGKIGDCNGTFELGMGLGICAEGDTKCMSGRGLGSKSCEGEGLRGRRGDGDVTGGHEMNRVQEKEVYSRRDQCKLKVE
jgi:hypothetical protein